MVEIGVPTIFSLGIDTRGTVFQHRLQKHLVFSHRLIENFDLSLDIVEMFGDLGSRDFRFKDVKPVCQLREVFLKF